MIDLYTRRRIANRIGMMLSSAAMAVGLIGLAWILWTLMFNGLSAFGIDLFTRSTPAPGSPGGGLANAIVGSLMIVGFSTLVATPVGILQPRFSGTDTVWRVVGLTHDQTFQASGTVTVDGEALRAAALSALAPAVNAVVVTSPTGHAGVLEELSRSLPAGDLTVLSTAEFINSLPGYTAQVLTFSLMIGALILIAALVLGIFLYVLTLQKRPVLGILKARGVPTAFLIVSGGVQTAVLAATGVLTGLVLTLLSGLVLPETVPFRLDPLLDAAVTGAFVVVAVLAGLMSVRLVTRIDPVEAIA